MFGCFIFVQGILTQTITSVQDEKNACDLQHNKGFNATRSRFLMCLLKRPRRADDLPDCVWTPVTGDALIFIHVSRGHLYIPSFPCRSKRALCRKSSSVMVQTIMMLIFSCVYHNVLNNAKVKSLSRSRTKARQTGRMKITRPSFFTPTSIV